MDIGKQSSCLTVTTGEWVCPQRKPLGKRLGSISKIGITSTDTDKIATPGSTAKGAHYNGMDGRRDNCTGTDSDRG
jgi:hypothetical protein